MWILIFLIIVALFFFAKNRKKAKKQTTTTMHTQEDPGYILSDKGEDIIRHAPKPDATLGFANMPEFEVSGKKKTTNRKNTRRIRCGNESIAKEYAISVEGLMEPLTVSLPEFRPARELEHGLSVPEGASYWDSDMFEWSVIAKDTKHIPPDFMEYITDMGVPMSWLSGRNRAAEEVFKRCDPQEKAALYGYAVHCFMQGRIPGNIEKEPLKNLYIEFANAAALDIKVYNSIAKRPGSDMWAPSQNTNAFRFAKTFFSQKI